MILVRPGNRGDSARRQLDRPLGPGRQVIGDEIVSAFIGRQEGDIRAVWRQGHLLVFRQGGIDFEWRRGVVRRPLPDDALDHDLGRRIVRWVARLGPGGNGRRRLSGDQHDTGIGPARGQPAAGQQPVQSVGRRIDAIEGDAGRTMHHLAIEQDLGAGGRGIGAQGRAHVLGRNSEAIAHCLAPCQAIGRHRHAEDRPGADAGGQPAPQALDMFSHVFPLAFPDPLRRYDRRTES